MDLQTFLNGIMDHFGGRAADTKLHGIIKRQGDILQESLEFSGRKFDFQRVENSESVNAGTTSPQVVALPTNYLSLPYGASLRLYDSAGDLAVVLSRRPFDELAFKVAPQDTVSNNDTPRYYDIINGSLYIFPYLTETFTLKYFYHRKAPKTITALGNTETNLWLTNAGNYFIAHVGLIVATSVIRDQTAIAAFNSLALLANQNLDNREAAAEQDDFDPSEETL